MKIIFTINNYPYNVCFQHAAPGTTLGNLKDQLAPGKHSRRIINKFRLGGLAAVTTRNSVLLPWHDSFKKVCRIIEELRLGRIAAVTTTSRRLCVES